MTPVLTVTVLEAQLVESFSHLTVVGQRGISRDAAANVQGHINVRGEPAAEVHCVLHCRPYILLGCAEFIYEGHDEHEDAVWQAFESTSAWDNPVSPRQTQVRLAIVYMTILL